MDLEAAQQELTDAEREHAAIDDAIKALQPTSLEPPKKLTLHTCIVTVHSVEAPKDEVVAVRISPPSAVANGGEASHAVSFEEPISFTVTASGLESLAFTVRSKAPREPAAGEAGADGAPEAVNGPEANGNGAADAAVHAVPAQNGTHEPVSEDAEEPVAAEEGGNAVVNGGSSSAPQEDDPVPAENGPATAPLEETEIVEREVSIDAAELVAMSEMSAVRGGVRFTAELKPQEESETADPADAAAAAQAAEDQREKELRLIMAFEEATNRLSKARADVSALQPSQPAPQKKASSSAKSSSGSAKPAGARKSALRKPAASRPAPPSNGLLARLSRRTGAWMWRGQVVATAVFWRGKNLGLFVAAIALMHTRGDLLAI